MCSNFLPFKPQYQHTPELFSYILLKIVGEFVEILNLLITGSHFIRFYKLVLIL